MEAAVGNADVVAAYGRHVLLRDDQGRPHAAVIRGRRREAVVGDRVVAAPASSDQMIIEQIAARRNVVRRSDGFREKSIAANLDRAFVVVSGAPRFDEALLLRVLIALGAEGIATGLIVTKSDLAEATAAIMPRLAVHEALGIPILRVSAGRGDDGAAGGDATGDATGDAVGDATGVAASGASGSASGSATSDATGDATGVAASDAAGGAPGDATGLGALSATLGGGRTLLLGQSGMGKSTLVNALIPTAAQQTASISRALNSGRHTTTVTRAFELPGGGTLIDSPGFQTFEVDHLSRWQIDHAMPEFADLLGHCRFNDCEHRGEPGCAVLEAREAGRIDDLRLRLYRELIDGRRRRRS
ncbi:MAG: ribosome small subunit-dependent GTPase A [Burkholderiaceae bacterium]